MINEEKNLVTDFLNPNIIGDISVHVSYGIPMFLHRDRKDRRNGVFFSDEGNRPGESQLLCLKDYC